MAGTGVNLSGTQAGGNITVNDVRVGYTPEELVTALQRIGLLHPAELAGLQRKTVINLARKLNKEALHFEQAVQELEYAVEIALDVIQRGEHGTNDDAFVNAVL